MLKYSESLKQRLHLASRQTAAPTKAQAEAGNYRKGYVSIHGLEISIETPRGKSRRPEWPPLIHHYGYILGMRKQSRVSYGPTADGDHLDVFIGDHPEVELVFVVDQIHPKTGKFDEHKCMLAFRSLEEAREGYLGNYTKGWQGLGDITPLTIRQFKDWIATGDLTKPLAGQKVKAASDSSPSTASQLAKVFLEPAVREWLGKRGLVAGDFNGGRNLLDVVEDDHFQQELHHAMRMAGESDRSGHEQLLRGLMHLAGRPVSEEAEKHIKALSSDISAIAPYAQRWAPKLWDQLHGSRGSVATLTHSIAEANRHRLSPTESHQIAEGVFKNLYGEADPFKTRGFSSAEMGDIYADLVRRGKLSPYDDADAISERLSQYAQPLSAIRDSLRSQGEATIDDVLQAAPQILTPELEQHGLTEAERQLRMGSVLGQQGGLFSASARTTGLPPGTDLAELEQADRQLRQQAQASPIGNMLAATHRIHREMGLSPQGEAYQAYQRMLAGEQPFQSSQDWLRTMSQSGIDPMAAYQILNQTARNQQFVTPELVDTVRRSQNQIDIQPRMLRYTAGMSHPAAIEGAQEQAAHEMGYGSLGRLQALHGEPLQQTPHMLDQARQQATTSSAVSHLATRQPLTRMIDAVRNATPETTPQDLLNEGLNVIPQSKILAMPGPLKAAADKTVTPIVHKQHTETRDVEYCPHCQEEIREKSIYMDAEHYVYHRPCQDKGPINKLQPPDEESMRQLLADWSNGAKQLGQDKEAKDSPTLAVDLDGTLAGMYEKFDPNLIEPPRPGARDAVRAWKEMGCKIIIFTVRGNKQRIREWLEEHDIPFDHINENPDNPKDSSGKPIADVYIDDRAVRADKPWSQIQEEVAELLQKD